MTGGIESASVLTQLAAALLTAGERAFGVAITQPEDDDLSVVWMSAGAAAMLGLDASSSVRLSSLIGLGGVAELRRFQRANESGYLDLEFRHHTAGTGWLRVSSSQLESADQYLNLLTDVSRQHDAQRLIGGVEARAKLVLDANLDALAVSSGSRLAYANAALISLLGYGRRQELEGAELQSVLPDGGEALLPHVRSRVLLQRSQGELLEADVLCLPIEWARVPSLLLVVQPLNKRGEEKEFADIDRFQAVGTLAAGVAHEINNPLAYVLLNLQYLERELEIASDPERLDQLAARAQEAQHGTERVSAIVRDLIAFSGRTELTPEPVDLGLVASAALRVCSPQLSSLSVSEDFSDVPPVLGNAAQLEQVVTNLLVNAAQAVAGTEVQSIGVRLRCEGESVVLEVVDSGLGIAAANLARVFDPFFTTKPVGEGMGLGLPICHSIVRAHGGDIAVESTFGAGACFRVTLPASQRQPSAPAALTPAPESAARARVLVVDDELPLATLLSRVLADEHDVQVCSSGQEALDRLTSGEFDVVLCDLMMPGMSGMDLFRELGLRRPGHERRLIFMTGGAFTPRAATFLEQVENPRIEKPFHLAAIKRLVRKLSQR